MLLGNYSILNRNPIRWMGGGTLTSPEVGNRSNWGSNGVAKNRQYVAMTTAANKQFSLPYGGSPPYSTLLPQKGGDLAARRTADLGFSATGSALMGYPISGTAVLSIVFSNAAGQLISAGSGSASFSVVPNTPLLTASISGSGAVTVTVTTNNPLLGAEASGQGIATLTFSVAGSILPLDSASPLRTGTSTVALSGTLVPYAVGSMIGTTAVVTELTTDAIAAAVWNAISSSFNDAGSMGSKLNTASSGGVDMDALAQTVWGYALRSMPLAERTAIADAVWEKELP